ncbi:MAG: hypothetical protein KatS3mg043_0816 [Rhodothermaceae bacterium]|nr:MAG: hypothetical protein KatS3mg043_0816 [Rhodothermaceae bacterium]
MKPPLTILLLTLLLAGGCDALQNVGRNSVREALDRADSLLVATDTLRIVGQKLTTGVRDSLLNPTTQARLHRLLDTLTMAADTALARMAVRVREEIAGAETDSALMRIERRFIANLDAFLVRLQGSAGGVRTNLIGAPAREDLRALARAATGDSLGLRLRTARDAVFDSTLHTYLVALVDSAATRGGDRVADKLARVLGEGGETGRGLLIVLGLVIAALMVLGWLLFHRSKKLKETTRLLTHQIHLIPSQASYDELTGRIQLKAQEMGLEPFLRKLLQEQGLLGEEAWKAQQKLKGGTSPG